jgi:hypothetical protein
MRNVVLSLLLLSGAAALSADQGAPPQPPATPPAAPAPQRLPQPATPVARMTPVTSAEAGFSVTMPCQPEPSQVTLPGQVQFECSTDRFYALVASIPLIIVEEPRAELDAEVALALQSAPDARVVGQEPIALGSYQGRLLRATIGGDNLITSRMYIAEDRNRLYRVVTVMNQTDNPEREISAFVDSFTLIDTPAADIRPVEITARLAGKMNQGLPQNIDPDTQLLFTFGLPGIMAYEYRLPNYALADIVQDRFVASMTNALLGTTCTGRIRTNLLDRDVIMRHVYVDKDLKQIGIVDISKTDCEAAAAGGAAPVPGR